MPESYAGKINRKLLKKQRIIAAAAGREPADLVLKNATFVNVFSNELSTMDIAVAEGLIVGMGSYQGRSEVDCTGKIVLPGFLDAHIHLESSLVSPTEFVKAVLPHGTTTVVTDPHEIANVMGTDGIEYMLQATEDLPVDVRFMLPSCVPATPLDESGANLDYRAIDSFYDHPRVQGLAEMMNFVGAINGDEQTVEKIVAAQAHHKKIDGHAPDLQGNDLNAYIAAGVYSDHECHDVKDAIAKLTALCKKHGVTHIAIGNGTASRETEAMTVELLRSFPDASYAIVNEAGASVYSASPLAAEEFPNYDVNLRSAVSIARRLQDPLAELVKIDPKAIGVGQYQHDMPQKRLDEALSGVVESREYYGLYIKYYITVEGQTLKVIEKNDGVNIYEPAQQVSVVINPAHVMAYEAGEEAAHA